MTITDFEAKTIRALQVGGTKSTEAERDTAKQMDSDAEWPHGIGSVSLLIASNAPIPVEI